MQATSSFFRWWFEAWGIGGWVVFLLLVIAAIAWLIYDSQTRRIAAVGWLMGAILPSLLLLPSAILGFSPAARVQMQNLQEIFFYFGLIGGIVPIVVAAGYFITYRGTRGCERGHVYDATLPECPVCAQERIREAPPVSRMPIPIPDREDLRRERAEMAGPRRPPKPAANAWLVEEGTNRTYQLNVGDTRIGRNRQINDIVLADTAVSREHLLVREDAGHFTLYDRGSKTGSLLNGRRVDSPLLLAHDDCIEIGNTRLRFVTSRR